MASRGKQKDPEENEEVGSPPLVVSVMAFRCEAVLGPPEKAVVLQVAGATEDGDKAEVILIIPATGIQDLRRDLRQSLEALLPLE